MVNENLLGLPYHFVDGEFSLISYIRKISMANLQKMATMINSEILISYLLTITR